jgi:hypothetical protein
VYNVGCAALTAAGRPRLVLALTLPVPISAVAGLAATVPAFGVVGAATVILAASWLAASLTGVAASWLWRVRPAPMTVVRSAAVSIATAVTAQAWSTPGGWVLVKIAVLGVLALAMLLAFRELKVGEIRTVLSFTGDR